MTSLRRLLTATAALALAAIASPTVEAQEFTLRITNPDAPYVQIDDMKYPYYVFGMMSAFGETVEALSKGRIKAEIYHSGTLGDLRRTPEPG